MSMLRIAAVDVLEAPAEGCFFCEDAQQDAARAKELYHRLLLAGPGEVRAAGRVRAHLQRLERALDRHACDSPRTRRSRTKAAAAA